MTPEVEVTPESGWELRFACSNCNLHYVLHIPHPDCNHNKVLHGPWFCPSCGYNFREGQFKTLICGCVMQGGKWYHKCTKHQR